MIGYIMSNLCKTLMLNAFFIWILLANDSWASSYMSCPIPHSFKPFYDFNWQSRNNEWTNTKSKTDYLLLSLSW